MIDHDRNNLNFLLNLNEHELKDWYTQATNDEILYASELLDAYEAELENGVWSEYTNAFIHHSSYLVH